MTAAASSPEKTVPACSGIQEQALDSRVLFGAQKELIITHNGEPYRLRITASDKLILTK